MCAYGWNEGVWFAEFVVDRFDDARGSVEDGLHYGVWCEVNSLFFSFFS